MVAIEFWQNLPPEARDLLVGLAGKLAEGVLKRIASTLGTALRGTAEEQALRAVLTQAVAAFLACLDLPEEPGARKRWEKQAHRTLRPIFADVRVQEALVDAVLHQGRPEGVDVAPFRAAWADHYGPGAEADLPWRKGQSLETAVLAFARAFEHEAEARRDLLLFLVAARLKRLLEVGARAEEIESLVQDMLRLTEQQVSLLERLIRQFPDEQQCRAEAIRQIALYRRALIRYCESLPYVSLPGARGKRPPLSTLYVRRRAQRKPGERENETLIPPPPPSAAPPPLYHPVGEGRGMGGGVRAPSLERLPTTEAVRRHPHLVLLGEPGAGKSTWLRYTVQRVADGRGEEVGIAEPLLPVLVRLGPLSREKGSFPERLREVLENELGLPLPEDFFEAWPKAAKAQGWLLACDGLDEIGNLKTRQDIARWLEGLAEGSHRVLVTSRPSGYAAAALDEAQFAAFELEPFTLEEAETFARHWFGAFLPPEEAEARAYGLLWAVHDREMEGLLINPLLLTVMAVVYHEQGTLPRHRKDLHEEFVKVLWEEAKRRGVKTALEARGLDEQSATRLVFLTPDLFPVVALTAHRKRTTDEKPLAEAVVPLLMEEMDLGRRVARRMALDWLRVVGRWSGALVARGRGYEFLHPTFREHLAARALAETHAGDPDGLWAELEPHLLDDEWAQVIPLALAQLKDATLLLERLLEANAEDEDRQRPLFLAAAALAEGAVAGEAVRRRVVDELEHLVRTRQWWAGEMTNAYDALATLGRMEREAYTAERLLALACDEGVYAWVRVGAAEALGRLGQIVATPEVMEGLRALVEDASAPERVRKAARRALRRLKGS